MRLARQFIIAALVLTSSSTLAEEVLAESREPKAFPFTCTSPTVGKERCGDADRNVRVGRAQRILATVKTVSPTPEEPTCFTFYAYHAVSGDQIGKSPPICELDKPTPIWANPNEGAVDLFMKVGSNKYEELLITGVYVVDHP